MIRVKYEFGTENLTKSMSNSVIASPSYTR